MITTVQWWRKKCKSKLNNKAQHKMKQLRK
jgi:hypothetical protein